MACNDVKFWAPKRTPKGSTYSLSIVGPAAAFSAVAEYDDPTSNPIVAWPSNQIAPGPKSQSLDLAGDHFVHITIGTLVPGSVVEVRAEVKAPTGAVVRYCRTINTSVPSEKITHQVRAS